MREIAKSVEKKPQKELEEVYDQIVKAITLCATKGLYGMTLTADFPDELYDYIPHIVGDLQGGGFTIHIISMSRSKMGVSISMFIIW